mgnify:CR=1 FL=1
MIPKNLIEEDILKAIKEVDAKGIPLDRHSTKWSVLYEDNHYPPKYLISKSTNWIKVKDFIKHRNAVNVIYYLANKQKKTLYIGKAENLGKRVKPGKKHMNMDGDWDLFKYDIVYPEYANILERIEDHTIRSFASILKNNNKYSSLELSAYKLVNKNW